MGLVCGTPTSFVPAAAAARTAQATTITPALGAGVKNSACLCALTVNRLSVEFDWRGVECTEYVDEVCGNLPHVKYWAGMQQQSCLNFQPLEHYVNRQLLYKTYFRGVKL